MSHSQSRRDKAGGKRGKSKSREKGKPAGQSSPKVDLLTSPNIERFLTRDAEITETLRLPTDATEILLTEKPSPSDAVTREAKLPCSKVQTGGTTNPSEGSDTPELLAKVKGDATSPVSTAKTISSELGQPSTTRTKSRLPSAKTTRGGRGVGRKKKTSSTKDTDDEYAPTTSKRQVQQSIKDIFPVRRSSRRPKALLESEEFERMAKKLRNKDEEGIAVVDVERKGRGVASTRPFKRGELICEYSGELISHEEAQRREEQYSQDSSIGCYMYYFVFKAKRFCVDATKDNGRLGRLLNHSKSSANVATKLVEVDNHPYLCLMAARDVAVGEELEYDYGERSREAVESHPWLAA